MAVVVVTGSAGLVGAETCRFFASKGFTVVGIDNGMRQYFFGPCASTDWSRERLQSELPKYIHHSADIRSEKQIDEIFSAYGSDIELIVHCAAQPSHDWAAREPLTDFTVNANGTLIMLEAFRKHAPKAVFIFCSTNKVYGDKPNTLPLIELETRWEVSPEHPFATNGIDESMSIDQSKHSLFGASKVAADVLVQEYGRYFGLNTAVFRGGCLTGPGHSGAELHGFLAYLMQCAISGKQYTVFGYKGKQVRDNIHSADLVSAFYEFFRSPRAGEVYNIGGSRFANCSMQEAIELCEKITGKAMTHVYKDENRIGDHIWYVSDVRKFRSHYPTWNLTKTVEQTLVEIHDELVRRMTPAACSKLAANS